MKLRPYQQKTINDIYQYLIDNPGKNPCVVLPTGSGKSVVIAEFCRDALTRYPDTRILMLTHIRELIEQNNDKLLRLWQGAPVGIYSAGLKSKDIDAITYAGIQSVRNKANDIGHINIVIIDEAHLISHKDEGSYRKLINDLKEINNKLIVIGFTATPWRLGHGRIDEGDAIFDALIEPATIEELQRDGYLAKLKSRVTTEKISTYGVHKRGGEYIESELQKAVDIDESNKTIVDEIIRLGDNYKHWLIFCVGVEHSNHIRDELKERGIIAETVTGETSITERDRILDDFKAGKIRAVTNANILTTGFDFPDIDLIIMLRPTMSPVLYAQQAGRGLRIKSHTDHCLVLDFAGNVRQHGPVTDIRTPQHKGEGDGVAPVKECPECDFYCHASASICQECGHEFKIKCLHCGAENKMNVDICIKCQENPRHKLELHSDDIQTGETRDDVLSWDWRETTSKAGNRMIVVTYTIGIGLKIREYLLPWSAGLPGRKAIKILSEIAEKTGLAKLPETITDMNTVPAPAFIYHKRDGDFYRVTGRQWSWETEEYNEEVPF